MLLNNPQHIDHILDLLGIDGLTGSYSFDGTRLTSPNHSDVEIAAAEASLDIVALDKQEALELCLTQRKAAYPQQSDYLDAVVKGDTVAQQAYIDACLAVKTKYPKP